jgi:hypothetical protein
MASWKRKNRPKRDLHFVDADGRVACNPRDREAAHRVEMEGIGTTDTGAVTCRKCRLAIRACLKTRRGRAIGHLGRVQGGEEGESPCGL